MSDQELQVLGTDYIPPLEYDGHGNLKKKFINLLGLFYQDSNLNNLFIYNEFSMTVEYARDAIWHDVKAGQELRDKDFVFVMEYLARTKKAEFSIESIRHAIVQLAEGNKYNPVRFYLSQMEWDQQPRLDKWLVNCVGAENSKYTHAVGAKFLMGSVARIFVPGIKFDNVLVLEGPENIGKSTIFRTLSHPWFCDSIDLTQKDKEIVEKMRGYWFLEVAEMFGVSDANQERIKSFLTRQDDVQRLPYERLTGTFKRQSVFCASSNKLSYLFGEEGNRRFWPVQCGVLNIDWLKENKDQLFAEAKYRWENGEDLFLNKELFEIAKKVQSEKLSVNEVWFSIIERFLISKNEATMQDILENCLKIDIREMTNRSYTINVGRILKRLGFEKKDYNARNPRYWYVREEVLAQMELARLTVVEEEY